MAGVVAISILCVGFLFLNVSSAIPLDLNICADRIIPCQCGTPGYPLYLELKQCTHFYRWKPQCKPCKAVNEKTLCSLYQHCLECDVNNNGCVKCPAGRYGKWCQRECDCQNGGVCNETGRCICPAGFRGNKCQKGEVQSIVCNQPIIPENSAIFDSSLKTQYTAGSVLSLECKKGFISVSRGAMRCEETGKWSQQAPVCVLAEKSCVDPGPLMNGKIMVATDVNGGHGYAIGTVVEFSCDPSFYLIGNTHATCFGNGTWTASLPKCVKGQCSCTCI